MEAQVSGLSILPQKLVQLSRSVFLSQAHASLQCCPFSTDSPAPVLSFFCISPFRLRTRNRHFPQGSRLQKKLMLMRMMSFKLRKRCVTHVVSLKLTFKLFREKFHFYPQLSKMTTSCSQLLVVGLSHPFHFPFITSHEARYNMKSSKTILRFDHKDLFRHVV